MLSISSKTLSAAAFALPLAFIASANAADYNKPQVAVPTVPVAGGDIRGCWHADQRLYGAYNLNFCIGQGAGSYTVRGGGLDCQAGLSWNRTYYGMYEVALRESRCGSGTDWSADTFTCHLEPVIDPYAQKPQVFVPIPSPARSVLTCTYRPSVAGWDPQSFTASRS